MNVVEIKKNNFKIVQNEMKIAANKKVKKNFKNCVS